MTFSIKLRPKIAKLLLKLPKRLFPDYRVVVNATLIDRNRQTLLDTQVSDSSSSSESSAVERRRCCRYCKRLDDSLEELDVEERTSSTPLTPSAKLSWSEEVERELYHQYEIPTPPPMPSSFLTPKATPSGRRLTLDDIGSVKVCLSLLMTFQGKVIFLAQTHTDKTAPNSRNTRSDGYSTEKICSLPFAIVS